MSGPAHVIVIGNEKGGTGKSTVAMHLAVSLLALGASVGTIDLDARQATLSRYVENRRRKAASGRALTMPDHEAVPPTSDVSSDEARFLAALERMRAAHDVVVVDTPGSDHPLSRLGHSYADTLVTPLNDSFIDLDVLAKVDPENMKISRPSHYSEMVWETKKLRALRGEKAVVDWFVLRNRLSTLDARNKREMERLLGELAKRIGFRLIGGLGERVIYRELFLEGLTLFDLGEGSGIEMSLSHVAARQELRRLVDALGLSRFAPGGRS
ncbi:division plane positioning ATPase MipZ [Telmatospirillum siberiense]|uniref:ATPase n=1 Tax=Telmatospirillum siberiense TaxID=382514 RepID=A0A2N3Q014_9PROT|nr:division plane positioning ATPase MipZ [Telmatospirillum siberiense]PKU25951.1 ATPase [Telmatospirillum siberiense]